MMFRDFDLTKDHLAGVDHFRTPRTRDKAEANRRRALHRINKNLVALEGQVRGTGAALLVLTGIIDPEERAFAAQVVGESSFNSAWYTAARDAKEMRKRLKLPEPVSRLSEHRADGVEMFQTAQIKLSYAKQLGERLVPALLDPQSAGQAEILGRHFGQAAGGAGLHLGCIALADELVLAEDIPTELAQEMTRECSTALQRSAREREQEIGVAPSLAQFAHRDSPLSVWWRNSAPDEAFRALSAAQDRFAIAC